MRKHSQRERSFLPILLLGCTALSNGSALAEFPPAQNTIRELPKATSALRGKYLADAGNCVSCHTRRRGPPFTGGVSFETPFGTIYSSNITPDPDTGIGNWTANDLVNAMHRGVGPGGRPLLPAFPYTSFTKVSDADVIDIYAYLQTLKPLRYTPPSNSLTFSVRWPLKLWNSLYFKEGRFLPNRDRSEEWNRGAYLVEGLAHCGACHTSRNALMAEIPTQAYAGGAIRDRVANEKVRRWSAVNLTGAKNGLGAWSVADLTKYLSTGFSPRAGTFGPMNDVIVNSLRNLNKEDVHAIAVYLKSLPPVQDTSETELAAQSSPRGESIYKDRCEKCHSPSGRGGMFSAPPVAGSAVVQAQDPSSLINVILYGPEAPKDISFGGWESMPAYAGVLSDEDVAELSNYLRGSWGNTAPPVDTKEVAQQR